MRAELLIQAHNQLIAEATGSLEKRIQYFEECFQIDQDEKRLGDHAAVVEDAANYLDAMKATEGFFWNENRANLGQTVSGRIGEDVLFLSVSDGGEDRGYSAKVNDVDVNKNCARRLWRYYGVPTRRRFVTAKLLESKE